jgi:hypothetical protein
MKTYNLTEAAEVAGVTKETLRAALNDGTLAGRNIGGKKGWITTRDALRAWVESGNKGSGISGLAEGENG